MAAFFGFVFIWYKWIVALPVVGIFGRLGWRYREGIKERMLFAWSFKKRFERLEKTISETADPHLQHCPNCKAEGKNVLMRVINSRKDCPAGFYIWLYNCPDCKTRTQVSFKAK